MGFIPIKFVVACLASDSTCTQKDSFHWLQRIGVADEAAMRDGENQRWYKLRLQPQLWCNRLRL